MPKRRDRRREENASEDEDYEVPAVADSTQTADKEEKEDCTRDMTET